MSDFIEINGEKVTGKQAVALLKMLYNDSKEIAGIFHGMNRSEKFRINWPDETKFADANWKTFVEAARLLYVQQLSDQKTPPAKAREIHLALVLQAKMGQGAEKDNRLQLAPNTQQFVGDPHENKKIMNNFGKNPNLRAALMNSIATRH